MFTQCFEAHLCYATIKLSLLLFILLQYSSKFREQSIFILALTQSILLYANAELTPEDANPLPGASNAQQSTELQHIFHSPLSFLPIPTSLSEDFGD